MKWPAWPCRTRRRPGPSGRSSAESPLPLIADIHFNHRLALASLEQGADAIRINPGNLGGAAKTKLVVEACRARGVPLRLGVNAGSLEADLLAQYGAPTAAGPGGQRPALGAAVRGLGFFRF